MVDEFVIPGVTCMGRGHRPYAPPEVGGRRCRQPGQVRKEAATTISCRVVGFHRMNCRVQRSSTQRQRMPASVWAQPDTTDVTDLLRDGFPPKISWIPAFAGMTGSG